MKKIEPFNPNGIYARKLNPEMDLINYEKPTKLQKMWKVATSNGGESFYELLRFYPEKEYLSNRTIVENYSIEFQTMGLRGDDDIFNLVDYLGKRSPNKKIETFRIDGNSLSFELNSIRFNGTLENQIITLHYYSNRKNNIRQLRFVPFNNFPICR